MGKAPDRHGSCSGRSEPATSNESASRRVGVVGLTGFVDMDADGVAERSWMWTIGEAKCGGIVTVSMRLSTVRISSQVLLQRAQD